VRGTLSSLPNATFTLQFFASSSCDTSGAGEGQNFIGSITITTSGNGKVKFTALLSEPVSPRSYITATAIDQAGNTSEFSPCRQVPAPTARSPIRFASSKFRVDEGAGAATITLVRRGDASDGLTVHYATSDGTAAEWFDYTGTSGPLSFEPGETTDSFIVPVANDALDEDDETVNLVLRDDAGRTLALATLRIVDDDAPPLVVFSSDSYTVSEDGTGIGVLVYLSMPSGKPVSVNFAARNTTARVRADYLPAAATLTFLPGTTSQQANVRLVNDTLNELDETIELMLSRAKNALLGNPFRASLTIQDDD
jgi:hypothetical protein